MKSLKALSFAFLLAFSLLSSESNAGELDTTWRVGDAVYLRSFCENKEDIMVVAEQLYVEQAKHIFIKFVEKGRCVTFPMFISGTLVEWIGVVKDIDDGGGSVWLVAIGPGRGSPVYFLMYDDDGPHPKQIRGV